MMVQSWSADVLHSAGIFHFLGVEMPISDSSIRPAFESAPSSQLGIRFSARVSVVIPAMNEARNLPHVFERMPKNVFEVVLVDGNSTDDTVAVAKEVWPSVKIIKQARRGKGNALAAGFAACSGDYIVMIDADGSMDPGEIRSFVAALDAGADYAKGSRFIHGGGSDDITRVRRAGNWGLNSITNTLFRTHYSDLCYGYNAFRRECVAAFGLPDHLDTGSGAYWGDGFEIETLINTRVAKAGLKIDEVPSFEYCRISGDSNLQTFRDGIRVLRTIMRERFSGEPVRAVAPRPAKSDVVPDANDPGRTQMAA